MTERVNRVGVLALELSDEFLRNATTHYDSLWSRLKAILAGPGTTPLDTRLVDAAGRDVSVLKEARSGLATSGDSRARTAVRLLDSAIESVQ